ncbi:hypothetical protein SUDANB6_00077 [Streptomyces sp. enrichment culture]|uniref:hypothetical protein n=1 Tax=Streptomyces sp. enrichment culture TaxID=1795815 RepID=UPI003F576080
MANPRQSSPAGPDGAGGPSVRRAVSLGSAAADPGPLPTPAARRPDTPGRNGSGDGGAARPAPESTETPETPDVPGSGTVPARPGTAGGAAEETTTPAAASAASAASAVPVSRQRQGPEGAAEPASGQARTGSQAESAAVGRGAPADGTAVPGAAAGAGADGPPPGNPKKPLLAAAGIAGVVLLAVPLLIWATDDSRQKKDDVAVAAGSDTLLEEDSSEVPKGDYAPAEPTPEPSTKKPSAQSSPVVEKAPPVVSSTSPAGESPKAAEKTEKTKKAERTGKAEKTEKTKKEETRTEEHEAPRLPENTAAYAAQRLAASNPGRHICYRVHMKGAGWTAPACDGAAAGQGRPITAINIAVVGATRVSANEYVQKDGWTTAWSSAADGTDLLLGSASSNAPNLSGYAVGVADGNVCHHHKLGGHDWGAYLCESSEGWRFGGSLEPNLWLESVKFNV